MRLNIHQQLVGLALLSFAGFCLFGLYALHTLNDSKIGGPTYERIARGKDLIADAMPSPGYLGGSYLSTMEMLEETDPAKLRAAIDASAKAHQEFDNRYADWAKDPPGGSSAPIARARTTTGSWTSSSFRRSWPATARRRARSRPARCAPSSTATRRRSSKRAGS